MILQDGLWVWAILVNPENSTTRMEVKLPTDAGAEGEEVSDLATPKTRTKATVWLEDPEFKGDEECKARDGQPDLNVKPKNCNDHNT